MRALLLAGVVTFAVAQAARADVIFNLSNVAFASSPGGSTPEGTLTGYFATNNALTAITTYNITASSAPATTGIPFGGSNYTTADSTVTAASLPSQFFELDTSNNYGELRLYFTSPLTTSGTITLNSSASYENEFLAGNRYPSGTIVAAATPTPTPVPEPASMALLGVGALGILVAAGWRRRSLGAA